MRTYIAHAVAMYAKMHASRAEFLERFRQEMPSMPKFRYIILYYRQLVILAAKPRIEAKAAAPRHTADADDEDFKDMRAFITPLSFLAPSTGHEVAAADAA